MWEGEGTVLFPFAALELPFTVRWTITYCSPHFECEQEVMMKDTLETVRTLLTFIPLDEEHFHLELSHTEWGKVVGKAHGEATKLSWTLEALEGAESFHKVAEGLCHFHAQYGYEELYRREVRGILRKKP